MPSYALQLNPHPSIVSTQLGNEREPLLLVDDVLLDPQSLIDYAAWESAFAPAGNPDGGYPGIRAAAPLPYVEAVVRGFLPVIRRVFGLREAALANAECSFSLTTLASAELTPQQRTPHIDTVYPLQFALLHYLCGPEFGGTSFYRHRATGYETLNQERAVDYDVARARELDERPPASGYVGDSDDYYERIGGCEAKLNRMAIYRSCLLHSAHVAAGANLLPDPRRGRLTANIFLNFREG